MSGTRAKQLRRQTPTGPRLILTCYACGASRGYGEPCHTCAQPLPEPTLSDIALTVLMGISVVGVGVGIAWALLALGLVR